MQNLLHSLIHKSSTSHHIEYSATDKPQKIFLSNHLSHALIALQALGASDTILQNFYQRYETGETGHGGPLIPFIPSKQEITDTNFISHLGDGSVLRPEAERDLGVYDAYRSFFITKLKNEGPTETVKKYFPLMVRGISGSAFHPLIHIGWALSIEDSHMLADGLAYLAYSHQDLGEILQQKPNAVNKTLVELLEAIRSDSAAYSSCLEKPGFQERMSALSTKTGSLCEQLSSQFQSSQESPLSLYFSVFNTVASLYEQNSRDFFLFHGLTSAYGIKFILELLDEPQQRELVRYFILAVVCAYIVQGSPPVIENPTISSPTTSWEDLAQRAINDDDEHKIKGVFVLREAEKWQPSPIHLSAAYKLIHTEWTYGPAQK